MEIGFYKDQNGIIHVKELCHLEKALQTESDQMHPWVFAFWLQNGSQASQMGARKYTTQYNKCGHLSESLIWFSGHHGGPIMLYKSTWV